MCYKDDVVEINLFFRPKWRKGGCWRRWRMRVRPLEKEEKNSDENFEAINPSTKRRTSRDKTKRKVQHPTESFDK